MEVWKQNLLKQLKQRNINAKSFQQLIERNNTLLFLERQLRTENFSLTQTKNILQNRVGELEEKVKIGVAVTQSKEADEALRNELTLSLKQNALNSKQLLEMHELAKLNEEKYQEKVNQLEELHSQYDDIKGAVETLKEEIDSKDETISVLKGELLQLQVTLVKSEENVQQLKRENRSLYNRLNKKLEDDVLKLNEANQYFVSIQNGPAPTPVAPVPSMTYDKRTSSILDMPSRTPIGASTLPKSSKKYFQVHNGEVNSIAYSQNGSMFTTGGSDKSLKVWDSYTLANKQTLTGPERTIMQVAFSQNDEYVLAASNDNAIRVWSLQLGRVRHCLLGHLSKVHTAQFTYDNEKVITGSHDRTIKVWDLQKRSCLRTIFCFSSCNDLYVSLDGTMIVSGHLDTHVRFWDLRSGDCVKEVTNIHTGQITSVVISPDGRQVLTSARDNTLKLIDIHTYDVQQTYSHDGYRNGLNCTRSCFSSDGRYIASGSMDGTVYVWNAASSHVEQVLKGVHKNTVTQVAWNPTGYQLASVDRSGYVSLWG